MPNLDAGGSGLFYGPDAINNKIIQTGDTLDGSTVTTLTALAGLADDTNQLAFLAALADGRRGIYRAAFTAVPEPGTAALAVSGMLPLAGIVLRRRRRR